MESHGTWQDLQAIANLKGRYFRCLDTKDWAGFEAVFTDDAVWSGGAYDGAMRTAAGIAAEISELLAGTVGAHYGHTPEIELTSDTTARGTWAMEETVWWPDGSRTHHYGHYHDTFERVDGEWRISEVVLTRLHSVRSGGTAE